VADLVQHLDAELAAVGAAQREQRDHERRERPDRRRVGSDSGLVGAEQGCGDREDQHERVRGDRCERPAVGVEGVAPTVQPTRRQILTGRLERQLEGLGLGRLQSGRRCYVFANSVRTRQEIT
jgi:hypothetical protein